MLPDAGGIAALLASSLAAGFVASMVGIGGGIVIVPVLVLGGFVTSTQVAVGTSLFAIIFTSLSSTLVYHRRGAIQVRTGLLLMPGLLLGVEAGARIAEQVSSAGLALTFGAILLYPAGLMLLGKTPSEVARGAADGDGAARKPVAWSLGIGLAGGLLAGLLGVGGGILMVPAMTFLLSIPMLACVATSLFAMIPASAFGAARHWTLGNLDWGLGLVLAVGMTAGAQAGSRLASRIPQVALRRLFGVALSYAALQMAYTGARGLAIGL